MKYKAYGEIWRNIEEYGVMEMMTEPTSVLGKASIL